MYLFCTFLHTLGNYGSNFGTSNYISGMPKLRNLGLLEHAWMEQFDLVGDYTSVAVSRAFNPDR